MRIPKLTVLILLVCTSALAQQRQIDSIENLLKTNLADSTRAFSMMRLAINYEGVDTARAAKLYTDGIEFARTRNLSFELGRLYHNQGIFFNTTGKYMLAKRSFERALTALDSSSHAGKELRIAGVYGDLGSTARYMNDYKGAITYRLKSIGILERLESSMLLLNAYLNLSSAYRDQNEFDKQELYAQKALVVARRVNTGDAYLRAYVYTAFALNSLDKYEESERHIDSARRYYSDQISQEVRVSFHLVAGNTYMNVNKLDEAKKEFEDSYAVARQFNAQYSMTQSKLQVSRVLALQKKFGEAEPLLLEAYKEAKLSGEAPQLHVALDYLSRLYEEKGDFRKALAYHKEFKSINDSMSSQQNKEYATSLEIQYETQRKADQILQLQAEQKIQQLTIARKNIFNYILIGGTITLLIVSLLLYRNYSQKQKIQQQRISELETEKNLAATRAVLEGEEQERTRLAKDLHDGLGGMLSGIKYSLNNMKGNLIMTPDNAQALEKSIDMLDNSIREMRRVAHNMMPEALVKFGLDTALKDFCNDINQTGVLKVTYQSIGMESSALNHTTSITVYRIVQELINNAIKHANAREVVVQLAQNAGQVSITVEDDGNGFDAGILKVNKGIGWSNIQHRVEFLKGQLDVKSSPGTGTSVLIEFPL